MLDLYCGIALLWAPTLSGPGFNKVPKVLRENAVRGLKGISLQASHHMNTVRNNGDGTLTTLNLVGQCWSMLVNVGQCAYLPFP